MASNPHTSIDSTAAEVLCADTEIRPTAARYATAIAIIIGMYVVVAAFTTAVSAGADPQPPWAPLIRTAIALMMAWCSLSAIWWARSHWTSHLKTLVALIACLAVWSALLVVLPEAGQNREAAASWAAAFTLQAVLTAVMVTAVELAFFNGRLHGPRHFSIAFLLLWTTLIACVLGGGRWLFALFGWNSKNFFASGYFDQLQAAAVANAVLAVGVLACTRASRTWPVGIIACAATVLLIATASTSAMRWLVFGGTFNPPFFRYLLLMVGEGMFVAATLLPLELAARGAFFRTKS